MCPAEHLNVEILLTQLLEGAVFRERILPRPRRDPDWIGFRGVHEDAERQSCLFVEHERVDIPGRRDQYRQRARDDEGAIAKDGATFRMPRGSHDGREHHHRRNLGQASERGGGAPDPDPSRRPGLEILHERKHADDPEKEHRRVGHERAAEEDRSGRRRHEECRRQSACGTDELGGERKRRGDGPRRKDDAHDASEVVLLAKHVVERGRHGRVERELALDVSIFSTPIHLGMKDVEVALVQVSCNGRRVNLTPAVTVEQRRANPGQSQSCAEDQNEDQREPERSNRRARVAHGAGTRWEGRVGTRSSF